MTTPYPHQLRALKRLRRLNYRGLLAHDMGLGKSLTSLLAARELDARPVVVVCPASLKLNWAREASVHLNWKAAVLNGRTPPKQTANLMRKHRLFIVNYDVLGRVRTGGKRKAGPGWLEFLRRLRPQLVILDEAHFCRGHRTARTQWVRELCRGVEHVLALSGTPLTNRPAELWPVVNLLWPEVFSSWPAYGHEFCGPRVTPWGIKYDGAEKLDVLHGRLVECGMLRKTKDEVLSGLPPVRRIVVPLELSDPEQYAEAQNDLIGWLAKTAPSKAKRARRAQRLVRYGYLKKLAALLKLAHVIGWVDNFLEGDGGKLVIFAHHWEVRDQLATHYGRRSVRIDGGMAPAERMRSLDRFNKDPQVRLLVGQTDAAGVGLSVTGGHTGCMVEFPWNPAALAQAEARFHGIGRGVAGRRSTLYLLVAEGTIEAELLRLIDRKAKVVNAVLDGAGAKPLQGKIDDFNLYNELEKALLRKRGKL